MEQPRIFDAEHRFLTIVWEHEPVNSTELVRLAEGELGWKKSTTYSVIKRLSERGVLRSENAVVTALVKRIEVQRYESEQLLEKAFDNSLPSFITAFLQDKKLSAAEAEEIRRMIAEATQ